MSPARLEHTVLLALGLAACGDKDSDTATDTGPCLDYATDDTAGPCLTPEEDLALGVNPELELPEATEPPVAADPTTAVLDRGVLPGDVAALLRARQEGETP